MTKLHRSWVWFFSLVPIGIVGGGLVSLIIWARLPEEFPIRVVEFNHEILQEDAREITEIMAQDMAKGFFGIDIKQAQSRLNHVPWVAQAMMRRVWPDKIMITIEEHVPLARFNNGAILSTEGIVFQPTRPEKYPLARLPNFTGPIDRAKEMQQQYLAFLEALAPLGISISELMLSEEGAWDLRFANGIQIRVGKGSLGERMARLVIAYHYIQNKLNDKLDQIDKLDLRYTNGISIAWKSGAHSKAMEVH